MATAQIDMTRGSILKAIIQFSIPLLIGNLFQQMYNMVDSLVVGNFNGSGALAAVGTAGQPMNVMMALFLGIGTGATILISQFTGAGDPDNVRNIVKTANTFLFLCAIPLSVVGIVLAAPMLHAMQVPGDIFDMATAYLAITFVGVIPNLGYNINSGILRGLGDSRSPLYFLVLSTAVNIVLDLLFVAVFGWGVAGVAAATVIAQFAAWIYSILFIRKRYPQLEMNPLKFGLQRDLLKGMIRLGLPIGFNNALFSLGHIFLMSLVNMQGSAFIAGYTSAMRIDNICFMPTASLSVAATTFSGQNVGAKQYDRIKRGIRSILLFTFVVNWVTALIPLLLGHQILALFTQDAAVIEAGYACFIRCVPFYWMIGANNILNNYMNGAGEVRMPTISNIILFWLVRLPAAYLLCYLWEPNALYFAYPISWAVGLAVSGWYYLSGKWRRHYLGENWRNPIPKT